MHVSLHEVFFHQKSSESEIKGSAVPRPVPFSVIHENCQGSNLLYYTSPKNYTYLCRLTYHTDENCQGSNLLYYTSPTCYTIHPQKTIPICVDLHITQWVFYSMEVGLGTVVPCSLLPQPRSSCFTTLRVGHYVHVNLTS